MLINAMKRALEALENHSGNYKLSKTECASHNAIVDELRSAIEAAEKMEPVGIVAHLHELNDSWLSTLPIGTKLYAIPPDTASLIAELQAEITALHATEQNLEALLKQALTALICINAALPFPAAAREIAAIKTHLEIK